MLSIKYYFSKLLHPIFGIFSHERIRETHICMHTWNNNQYECLTERKTKVQKVGEVAQSSCKNKTGRAQGV